MSEEKRTFYKTLNNIVATNRIDNEEAYIINNYVSGLENIIKEIRETLNNKRTIMTTQLLNGGYCNYEELLYQVDEEIRKILDKGE